MLQQGGSLVDKASEEIIRLIIDHPYEAGEQIPTEPELCDKLGASRNTIREAIRALVARNVLEIHRGNGTFVSSKRGIPNDPLGITFIEDKKQAAEDLMQIRFILEPPLAVLAVQNATEKDIEQLNQCRLDYENAVKEGKNPIEFDIAFHKQLAFCTKNVMMPNLIGVITETIRIFSNLESGLEIESTIKSHREIYEAIANKRASDAQDAMMIHLAQNRRKLKKEESSKE